MGTMKAGQVNRSGKRGTTRVRRRGIFGEMGVPGESTCPHLPSLLRSERLGDAMIEHVEEINVLGGVLTLMRDLSDLGRH